MQNKAPITGVESISDLVDFNEALSSREIMQAISEGGLELRRSFQENFIQSPIDDKTLREWDDRLDSGRKNNTSRMQFRTRQILQESSSYQSTPPHATDSILLVGGPAGSGKSSVAKWLGGHFGVPVVDGDILHTDEAVLKMNNRQPIDNDYRLGQWLPRLDTTVKNIQRETYLPSIVVCSALNEDVRAGLRLLFGEYNTIFCYAPSSVLRDRVQKRNHAFIPADAPAFIEAQIDGMLKSQVPMKNDPHALLLNTNEDIASVRSTASTFAERRWEA